MGQMVYLDLQVKRGTEDKKEYKDLQVFQVSVVFLV